MNPEVKEKWIKALRSGEYTQTQNVLMRRGETHMHCCLGVLCDLIGMRPNFGKHEGIAEVHEASGDGLGGWYGTMPNGGLLPTYAQRRTKLDTAVQQRLARMNDAGKNFDEIADYIEENL